MPGARRVSSRTPTRCSRCAPTAATTPAAPSAADRSPPRCAGSRHADAVWECSHIGGDRFAGNLLVLPRGLYHGHLDPSSALEVADALADGRLALDHLRGRSDLAMPVQAADIAVRRRLGLTGLDDVRPTSARSDGDLTSVTLAAADEEVTVQVRRVLEPAQQLTCGAQRDNPVPRFEVL